MRPEQKPYGVEDFKRTRRESWHDVDTTAFIRKMEETAGSPLFARPRRKGMRIAR